MEAERIAAQVAEKYAQQIDALGIEQEREQFVTEASGLIKSAILEALSLNEGWIEVTPETMPEEGERVLVRIVDDNRSEQKGRGGKIIKYGRREVYADVWNYEPTHPSWTDGTVSHYRRFQMPIDTPAPPSQEKL